MGKLLRAARSRAGIVVGTVGLVLIAGGVATAAVIAEPGPEETSHVTTTEPVETTAPAAPTSEAVVQPAPVDAPAEPPAQGAPAATVDDVTEPQAPVAVEPEPAPVDAPQEYDPTAPFTDEAGQTYLPGPDVPAPSMPPPGD